MKSARDFLYIVTEERFCFFLEECRKIIINFYAIQNGMNENWADKWNKTPLRVATTTTSKWAKKRPFRLIDCINTICDKPILSHFYSSIRNRNICCNRIYYDSCPIRATANNNNENQTKNKKKKKKKGNGNNNTFDSNYQLFESTGTKPAIYTFIPTQWILSTKPTKA